MKNKKYKIENIKGDASFRKFYRKYFNLKSSIIVFANKEKEKNLLIYDAINKILIRNKIKAPKLIKQKYSLNYIEIEDLGKKTMLNFLNKSQNDLKYFKKAIDLLNKLQKIKNKKTKNFIKQTYVMPNYSKEILYKEAVLFCDWYVISALTKSKHKKFNSLLKRELRKILTKLNYKNDCFVHRDFHVSNIMLNKNTISLIDSQDALIGNKAYDLASLIDDVRFKTSNDIKHKMFSYFLKTRRELFPEKFKNDFEILSVLRNLKIIGIFKRLAIRDNKKKYLRLIPYAWKLINLRINQNRNLNKLKLILQREFPKEIK